MNKQIFDNAKPTTSLIRRWQANNWTRPGRLLLACWFLATTGCALTAKLQPLSRAADNESSINAPEPKQQPESESNDDSSQVEQIELVAFQNELLPPQNELLPAPLPEATQEPLIADEQSMIAEHLPLPAPHLPPISPAIGVATPQYQIDPSRPTTVTSPQIVNLRGASFRDSPKTATEIMLELKAENDRLRHQLATGKRDYNDLVKQFKDQKKINLRLAGKFDRSQSESAQLRSMVAKLKVQVDRLVVDKTNIKRQSEAALREIESNLDTVLLDSISRARQTPPTAN